MQTTKRSIAAGCLVAALLTGFVLYVREDYLLDPDYGKALLAFSLLLCLLSGAAVAVSPDFESPKFRPKLYTAWAVFLLLLAPMIMIAAIERLNGNFLWELYSFPHVTDNWAIALVLYLLLYALTGSIRGSILTVSPMLLLFGIANMYVKAFKGSPLLPMDCGAIATAAKVADRYEYSVGFEVCFAVVLTVFAMALACRLAMPKWKKRTRYALRAVVLAGVLVTVGLFYGTDLPVKMGMRPDFFNQTRGYEGRGALREFANNSRYLWLREPAGYDPDTLEARVQAETRGKTPRIFSGDPGKDLPKKPDIIVVMNESFSDLTQVADFTASEEVLPNYTALKKEGISGSVYVSVRGTGTSNTEYEMLTGNSMAFLPAGSNAYQLYVGEDQPGLVRELLDLGYSAEASHPYFSANWNRPEVYEEMGFEKYLAMEDMFLDEVDPPARAYLEGKGTRGNLVANLRRLYPDELTTVGGCVSDHLGYKKMEGMYEARDTSRPYFHFHVTMQNHSPYTNSYGNFPSTVELTGLKGDYPEAEQYLTRIRASDEALKELTDYYRSADRPVILLFFGDHQPVVESGFYEEISGSDLSDWPDEKTLSLYQTPFLIWANYDIPKGEVEKISANYLKVLLLQTAGLPLSPYDEYLAGLYQEYPVITAQGCLDKEGHFFAAEDKKEELSLYEELSYNSLKDVRHRALSLFSL